MKLNTNYICQPSNFIKECLSWRAVPQDFLDSVLDQLVESIYFLYEAKTTAPNPQGEKGPKRFNAFVEEIFSKFIHSLQLCYATVANIQTEDTEDPCRQSKEFFAELHKGPCIRFLLIIKNSRPEWNSHIQDMLHMLQMKLNSQQFNTIWKSTIIVMNETQAKARKLIVD